MAKHTKTSSFGVSGRESHDASAYYNRNLAKATVSTDEIINPMPVLAENRLFCQSSETMGQLPDNSVALMVTSPSYHVGKDFDSNDTFVNYLAMLGRVFEETYRVLEPGGRACINLANLGRKPYIHFTDIVAEMCTDIGFLPRGEIIWVKGKGAAGSCAFGSYKSAANPVLRDLHEYILCMSKGRFDRAISRVDRAEVGLPYENTISKEDFLSCSLSVWEMRPESAKRVGHPAPFPLELPRRLIEFYTYVGDTVLDPFIGSGTTAVAAKALGRNYVGYDTDADYIDKAIDRVDASPGPVPAEEGPVAS